MEYWAIQNLVKKKKKRKDDQIINIKMFPNFVIYLKNIFIFLKVVI